MTYMNHDFNSAKSCGIQELNLAEIEQVGGALTVEQILFMGYLLSGSAKIFISNPLAGLRSFYYDIKLFLTWI